MSRLGVARLRSSPVVECCRREVRAYPVAVVEVVAQPQLGLHVALARRSLVEGECALRERGARKTGDGPASVLT